MRRDKKKRDVQLKKTPIWFISISVKFSLGLQSWGGMRRPTMFFSSRSVPNLPINIFNVKSMGPKSLCGIYLMPLKKKSDFTLAAAVPSPSHINLHKHFFQSSFGNNGKDTGGYWTSTRERPSNPACWTSLTRRRLLDSECDRNQFNEFVIIFFKRHFRSFSASVGISPARKCQCQLEWEDASRYLFGDVVMQREFPSVYFHAYHVNGTVFFLRAQQFDRLYQRRSLQPTE